MNYLRGAVNAISAPYQYYKDLPPINPSTLTGAIDVIVIQRPTDNGDTELACSPFHVRFGKWQVLRPSEKKVNVSVNGHPIPFNMKIGEAGEAFFVFETDDDVPADLITSPILQPTRPDDEQANTDQVPSERFGASQEPEEKMELGSEEDAEMHTNNNEELRVEEPNTHEPEFLDLDAMPSAQKSEEDGKETQQANTTPKQTPFKPSIEKKLSNASISQPALSLPSPPPSREHSKSRKHTQEHIQDPSRMPQVDALDKRVDETLKYVRDEMHVPEVEYHHNIALDAEGYHSHGKERSDQTIRSSDEFEFPPRPRSRTKSSTPEPGRPVHTQSTLNSTHQSYSSSPSIDSPSDSPIPFSNFRATSEPPPDMEELEHPPMPAEPSSSKLAPAPVQEYSWEWGAFPQPSPMKTTFGKGGRIENKTWGKGRSAGLAQELHSGLAEAVDLAVEDDDEGGSVSKGNSLRKIEKEPESATRSRSVPPDLDTRTLKKRRSREIKEYEDFDEEGRIRSQQEEEKLFENEWDAVFGAGGRLSAKKDDPSIFILSIEGRKTSFELSLVDGKDDQEDTRGRKDRNGKRGGSILGARDEVEAAGLFDTGKIEFEQFLEDDVIVNDPRLVIRWAGEQYITRADGSPLHAALVHWRQSALQQQSIGLPSRPVSPLDSDEDHLPPSAASTTSLPSSASQDAGQTEESATAGKKPTSLSWVQWWSRSRRKDNQAAAKSKGERPGLRGAASAPVAPELPSGAPEGKLSKSKSYIDKGVKEIGSVPALPSTPAQQPVDIPPESTPTTPAQDAPAHPKKFAKTLRLTSDQLKALNLKPGANSITFSLSASGVPAATARIFVWDSTDAVVVSDIDGTITKSDGLGHVFAMIGRDWTHLGVAKLYTDITRNGYKIMYLTSRAIGQADATRDYLKGIKQNDYQLPEGPVIMSPDRLMASLHREVIMRKPEVFKMACLRDIRRLFGESAKNPFYAGFGNRITDALSYRSVDIPSAKIFTIDSAGEVKMELLELAGYKSSYIHMTDLVDQMFPPIHRKWAPEYTDFNYWKAPVQDFLLPDLSPPSPALSARSDTSNQSTLARLRNFSLVGSRQPTLKPYTTDSSGITPEPEHYRSTHLRQMSSFEKISTTLGFMSTVNNIRRSASPESRSSSPTTFADSDDEDGEGWEADADGNRRRRQRRRSMTSMPGSLDDLHFDNDEDEEDEHEYHEDEEAEGEDEEAVVEETFDDDLLATGEMQNVPFL